MAWSQRGVYRRLLAASTAIGIGCVALFGNAVASSRPAPPPAGLGPRLAAGPNAVIADPGDAQIGVPVRFDASASQGDGLSFAWDFGDRTALATGSTTQHTFTLVDDYHVQLTVRDGHNGSATATRTVRVLPTVETLVGRPELGQIVPASSFSAVLSLNAAGPATVSVKLGGPFLSSDSWDFVGGNSRALLEIPDIRVANEDDPIIVDQLLSKPGAAILLGGNVGVTISYPVSGGSTESSTYSMSLIKDTPVPTPQSAPAPAPVAPPSTVWTITYPSYLALVGRPVNADDIDDYYLKGDSQFHSVDTLALRQFAIKIARNGSIFPNDPQRAADNIYRYVQGLLGIGDPGELQKDLTIISRVKDGSLATGKRNGEYICIAHAYFVSSLTRTLGLPTRELTVGFGRGVAQEDTGAWKLNFYQEGANEVWYAGAWHHYDTWVGTRNRDDYLENNLTEIAWYAFSEQKTPFVDLNDQSVGLAGHDFALGKYVGSPGAPAQWRFLEQHTRPGVRLADPGPEAYFSVNHSESAQPLEIVVAGVLDPDSGD